MGKVTKKESKVCGISERRLRKIVQDRILADRNFLQSQMNSSTNVEKSIPGISNIHFQSSNDNGLPLAASNLNVNINSLENTETGDLDVQLPSSNIKLPSFADNGPQSNAGRSTIDFSSSSLFTGNNENSREQCNETNGSESFAMDYNATDNFILNDDSSDSDTEITTNEDTRKTDSELSEDDIGKDDFEIPDYPSDDEARMKDTEFSTQLRQ